MSLRAGLVRMALVAVVGLAAGLMGALIGRNLMYVDDPSSGSRVIVGDPSPRPESPTADLGKEIHLLAPSGEYQPDVDPDTLDGDVIAVGRIEGTDVEVARWKTAGPLGAYVQILSSNVRDRFCSSSLEPGQSSRPPWSVVRLDTSSGEPVDVVAVWAVPDGTSVVSVEAGELRVWQRPVSGFAAFTLEPGIPLVTMRALNPSGVAIVETGFSPLQTHSAEIRRDVREEDP